MLGALLGTLFWWAAYLLVFRQDRRRVRNGMLLLIALYSTLALIGRLLETAVPMGEVLVFVGLLLALLGVLALAIFLLGNGLTMVRKEGRSLGNLLSGLAGLALLGAPVGAAALMLSLGPVGLVLGMLLALLALHVGTAFLVFLCASLPYQLFPERLETGGIIVHGSGLIRGRVPTLLRHRLDRAVAERRRLRGLGIDPVLVPSGGRGEDEPRPEGEAMAEYLVEEAGVPADRVLPETASRTTEENLTLSRRILVEAGIEPPYVVSTSHYHAFRAALLARSLGYGDQAVGAPTAFYFVPSATLREFIAIASYRKVWLALAFVPSLAFVVLLARAAMLYA